MKKRMLVMDACDNVGVLLEPAQKNDAVSFADIDLTVSEPIDFAHKIALKNISRGEDIIKYGEVIGYALEDIALGQWVHIHNIDDIHGREGKVL